MFMDVYICQNREALSAHYLKRSLQGLTKTLKILKACTNIAYKNKNNSRADNQNIEMETIRERIKP